MRHQVNAELALLEQQQKAQEALDDKIAEISALPGQVQQKTLQAADETAAAVKAAPQNLLDSVTGSVKRTLDGAQASVSAACGNWSLDRSTTAHHPGFSLRYALGTSSGPNSRLQCGCEAGPSCLFRGVARPGEGRAQRGQVQDQGRLRPDASGHASCHAGTPLYPPSPA